MRLRKVALEVDEITWIRRYKTNKPYNQLNFVVQECELEVFNVRSYLYLNCENK